MLYLIILIVMKKITLELIGIFNSYSVLGIFSHEHKNQVRNETLWKLKLDNHCAKMIRVKPDGVLPCLW